MAVGVNCEVGSHAPTVTPKLGYFPKVFSLQCQLNQHHNLPA